MNFEWLFQLWLVLIVLGFILAPVIYAMMHRLNVYVRLIPATFLVAVGVMSGPLVFVGVGVSGHLLDLESLRLLGEVSIPLIGVWTTAYFVALLAILAVRFIGKRQPSVKSATRKTE